MEQKIYSKIIEKIIEKFNSMLYAQVDLKSSDIIQMDIGNSGSEKLPGLTTNKIELALS